MLIKPTTLLKVACVAVLALTGVRSQTSGTGPFVIPASRPVPGIIEVGDTKQVFLDDRVIHEASKLSKWVSRPEKFARNPIMVADRPWEQGTRIRGQHPAHGVQITGQNVIYDEEERIFKMWYLPYVVAWTGDGDERRPLCYAVSKDGYKWEKPELGIFEYRGSKANNILMANGPEAAHYFNVIKDPQEKDPQRRYKALGEMEGAIANQTGGVAIAFSPDGLHWTEHPGNPVVRHGRNIADAPTILGWDHKRRKYVAYYRPGHPLAGEIYGDGDHRHIRTYGYSESEDFIHWTPTELMLTPDHEDRADYQYMQFTAGIDGEFYIGFNAMHETHEQTWDIFLMSSRDGFNWNWLERKVPFLGRGEVGTYDAGYMTPSGPIFHDGKVWIYYGTYSGAHSYNLTKLGDNRLAIALCTLPQDRWMGLMAGPQRGTLVTKPLIFKGAKLIVDLDASVPLQAPHTPRRFDEFVLRAALEDQSGGAIEGFGLAQSNEITTSGPQELKWTGGDLSKLAGRPIRVRFEWRNAVFYSFQFSNP